MVQQLSYFSNQFHENIFKEDKLKYSFAEEFNDILDTQILLTDNAIDKIMFELNQHKEIVDRIFVEYSLEVLKTMCIICLIRQSPLDLITSNMWGLYAGKGCGFAIVFDLNTIYSRCQRNSLTTNCIINPVTYTSKTNKLYDLIKQYLQVQILPARGNVFALSQPIIKEMILTKSIMWQHEHEYRIYDPSPIHDAVVSTMKDRSKSQTVRANILREFRQNKIGPNNVDRFEFIKINKNDTYEFKKTDYPNFRLPIITLPAPIAIYLGWKFDVNNKQCMEIIKDFCIRHEIKNLHKLTGKVDYENNKFEIGDNLLSNQIT